METCPLRNRKKRVKQADLMTFASLEGLRKRTQNLFYQFACYEKGIYYERKISTETFCFGNGLPVFGGDNRINSQCSMVVLVFINILLNNVVVLNLVFIFKLFGIERLQCGGQPDRRSLCRWRRRHDQTFVFVNVRLD